MIWRVLVFVIAVFLSACSATPSIEQAKHLPPGEGIVFGKITVVEEGEEQKWGVPIGAMGFIQNFKLFLLPERTNGVGDFDLKEDGTFYWSLAPGNYRILGYERSLGSHTRGGRIGARFMVPKGKAPVYIGNLTMIITDGRHKFGLKDDFGTAVKKLRKLFPKAKGAPKKTLLTLEKPAGSYGRVLGICSELWGIDKCDRDHQGLMPITPEASGKFPVVSSLTPKFEWKPSSRDDVTYDIIIYEAVTRISDESREYLPGRVVFYKENLKQPNFELKQPLKRSQKYYWSVRLRHRQDVSSWSRHGYFIFFVIGRASGSGLWFTFETPDADD